MNSSETESAGVWEKLNERMKGLQYAGREVRIGIYGVCKKGNRRMRGFEHAGWGGKKKGEIED